MLLPGFYYSPDAIAAYLATNNSEYKEIETDKRLLTVKQTGQLGLIEIQQFINGNEIYTG